MSHTRRPYQQEAIDAIEKYVFTGDIQRGLVVMPTGTGKTQVFTWAAKLARETYGLFPALVIAHREELIEQATNRFLSVDDMLRVGIEKSTSSIMEEVDVIVASIQSIGRKETTRVKRWPNKPQLVIIDEAHHAAADTYKRVCHELGCFTWGGPFLLGFTATPKRMDKNALLCEDGNAVFERVVYNYPIRRAMEENYLCDLRGYRVITNVDISEVGIVGGDFNAKKLAKAVDSPIRTAQILEKWLEVAGSRRTIAYGVDVNHARDIAAVWSQSGVPSGFVHGAMRPDERKEVMEAFRHGDIRLLANCEIATEGVDFPFCDCIVMARPTKSWSLYCQMVGRGTRIHPGKSDCIVLDAVDNCGKHNICTLPSMLDLPPTLDLQGKTIKEADDLATALGERISDPRLPSTFEALQNLSLEAVSLVDFRVPSEVQQYSRLAWMPTRDGYAMSAGGKGNRIEVLEDAVGNYSLRITREGRIRTAKGASGSLQEALKYGDLWANKIWPGIGALNDTGAKWRRDLPTDKQLSLLRKLRVAETVLDSINKGEASSLITKMLNEREKHYV
jgi:ATP-dependent helicase IRC3